MISIAEKFAQAVAEHRAGRITAAARRYRSVLAIAPGHARAWHLLGFALLQSHAAAPAEVALKRALRQSPLTADVWTHLGLAQVELQRGQDACDAFRRALTLDPGRTEAQHGLARTLLAERPPAAGRLARRQIMLDPMHAGGWHSLGLALAGPAPGTPDGVRPIRVLQRAVILGPADAPALTDLSSLFRSNRQPVAASRAARRSLCLAMMSAPARVNLAAALFDLDDVERAMAAARSAAMLVPRIAEAYGNLAQCDYRRARFHRAVGNGRRALVAQPGDPQIEANLSTYHLALGDLDRGWPLFRNRPARRAIAQRQDLPAREWAGEPDARLLVVAEQGLGDELLFASCWADLAGLKQRGRLAEVCVELDARLRPLAERSFPELQWADRDRRIAGSGGQWRSADFPASHWIAAGDLPSRFRRRLGDFPAQPRYLLPDPARVAVYRRWLEASAPGQRRVGLCWRSGLRTEDRRKYYPDLADCRSLFRIRTLRTVVLQYDECAAEIAHAINPGDTPPLVPPGLDRRDDLDGVAALMTALDGVLSAETAVLALAGALGAPSVGFDIATNWVALGQRCAPWHPTVTRLHRGRDESWVDLMARVAATQA